MSAIRHSLYAVLIRLHPPTFRKEFGREMELDFKEASGHTAFTFLLLDVLRSLIRQWAVSAWPAAAGQHEIARPSLLAGQYVMASPGNLTPLDLARAAVLCFIFYLSVGFAMTHGNGRMMTDLQAGLATSQGYSGQGQRSPTDGPQTSDARHAAMTSDSVSGADNEADAQNRRIQTNLATANGHRKPALRKHSQYSAPGTGMTLWPLIALAAIVWLVPQFLSRNSRVGRRVVLATLVFVAIALPMAFGVMQMTAVHGQILHGGNSLPAFEVVSVRPWRPTLSPTPPPPPPPPDGTIASPKSRERVVPLAGGGQTTDRVRMILPANMLIASAYGLSAGFEDRVLGGPEWIGSDQYEIQAKIEDSLFASMKTMTPAKQREQVALMEQSLLADRFKMKTHFETREMPVFALVVAKGGTKLTPAKEGETARLSVVDVGGAFQMTATSVSLDAWLHSPFLGGRPVVDQTGLKGLYDFQLTWRPTQPAVPDDGQEGGADPPPLATAVREQLGLKLMQTKGPVEVIVIDHIERPSAN